MRSPVRALRKYQLQNKLTKSAQTLYIVNEYLFMYSFRLVYGRATVYTCVLFICYNYSIHVVCSDCVETHLIPGLSYYPTSALVHHVIVICMIMFTCDCGIQLTQNITPKSSKRAFFWQGTHLNLSWSVTGNKSRQNQVIFLTHHAKYHFVLWGIVENLKV